MHFVCMRNVECGMWNVNRLDPYNAGAQVPEKIPNKKFVMRLAVVANAVHLLHKSKVATSVPSTRKTFSLHGLQTESNPRMRMCTMWWHTSELEKNKSIAGMERERKRLSNGAIKRRKEFRKNRPTHLLYILCDMLGMFDSERFAPSMRHRYHRTFFLQYMDYERGRSTKRIKSFRISCRFAIVNILMPEQGIRRLDQWMTIKKQRGKFIRLMSKCIENTNALGWRTENP